MSCDSAPRQLDILQRLCLGRPGRVQALATASPRYGFIAHVPAHSRLVHVLPSPPLQRRQFGLPLKPHGKKHWASIETRLVGAVDTSQHWRICCVTINSPEAQLLICSRPSWIGWTYKTQPPRIMSGGSSSWKSVVSRCRLNVQWY